MAKDKDNSKLAAHKPGELSLAQFYRYLPPKSLRGAGGVAFFMTCMGLAPNQVEPFASIIRYVLLAGFLLSFICLLIGIVHPDNPVE